MMSTDNNNAVVGNVSGGKILNLISLYSDQCSNLLISSFDYLQKLQETEASTKAINYAKVGVVYRDGIAVADLSQVRNNIQLTNLQKQSRYISSSSSDDEQNVTAHNKGSQDKRDELSFSSSSSDAESSSSSSDNEVFNNDSNNEQKPIVPDPNEKIQQAKQQRRPRNSKKSKPQLSDKQQEQLIKKHWETVPVLRLPIPDDSSNRQKALVLELPSSLLSSHELGSELSTSQRCESYQKLLSNMNQQEKKTCSIVVLCLRSGRFAGGVFATPSDNDTTKKSSTCCITHRTSVRYTVRKGQGKAQSTQDGNRRPKSMGAQLRRAGEINLQTDVSKTIIEWKDYIHQASIIFISVPKAMQKSLFEGVADVDGKGTISVETILKKRDPRIRRVPLDLGRPSYENVCLIHTIMTTVVIREYDVLSNVPSSEAGLDVPNNKSNNTTKADKAQKITPDDDNEAEYYPPLTALHVAVQEGNVEQIKSILESSTESTTVNEWKNQRAGEYYMTPLHLAAMSTDYNIDASISAECVSLLLEEGHCDPCIVDVRNRVPYFLASHEKVRDAFRMSRASLGEEYCSWDESAKVGPPLTQQDIQLKKEKEAEKKRKKRQRLKEKKEQERLQAIEMQQRQKEEEEQRQKEEEAKRIRDGLQPKKNGTNLPLGGVACDFCQTVCTGKKKTQMFKRLDYKYCSTDCVEKHKRELMANAALARFSS